MVDMANEETPGAAPAAAPAPAPLSHAPIPVPITGPDAILFDAKWKPSGQTFRHRVHNTLEKLEILFYGSPHAGQAHFREVGGGRFLGSKTAGEAGVGFPLNYPADHDLAGQPRFRWEPGADGSKLGYFLSPNGA
jgi:hypothetical protein